MLQSFLIRVLLYNQYYISVYPKILDLHLLYFAMDNLAQQIDEIEALTAIYGDDWQIEDAENRAYSINIKVNEETVKLYLKLPDNYPSSAPPFYELSAPHLSSIQKQSICRQLEEVYLSFIGQNVLYQWIEKIREELQNYSLQKLSITENNNINDENLQTTIVPRSISPNKEVPTIYHGEVIVDRKSSFQGHAAQVSSIDEVRLVLAKLVEIKKIQQATHNMYAYRIYVEQRKNYLQDCNDDGESQAGGRLLHLLQIVDVKNVIVIVTRWYGGIHLGPERFRHINNAARQILEASNLISRNKHHKK